MNPLLMIAVRNAKIQTTITRDGEVNGSDIDSSGFPLSIVHDIKVVVETFRLLIRSDWQYSTDRQQTVHWNEARMEDLSPSNHCQGSTSGEEPSPAPSNSSPSSKMPVI